MSYAYAIAAVLMLLAWLAPLHVPPWVSSTNEFLAALALIVPCAVALSRRSPASGAPPIWIPSSAAPFLLLVAIALVQVSFGVIVYWGSFWVIAFYGAIAVVALAAGYAADGAGVTGMGSSANADRRSDSPLDILAGTLLVAGLAQTLLVFAQVFELWQGAEWIARSRYATRGTGNIAQPNQAAQLFLLSIASALHLFRQGRVRGQTVIALLLLLCAGLSTTESRSGALALGLLGAWWAYRGSPARPVANVAWAAGFVAAFAAMFIAWPRLAAAYWFLGEADSVNLTSSGRTGLWLQLVDAVTMHPWVGWGVHQVAQAQMAVADSYTSVLPTMFSHNLLLDIAIWAGLPVAAGFVVMVMVWCVRRLAAFRSPGTWYCVALVLPLALQSLTEYPFAYTYCLVPAGFALGALDRRLGLKRGIALGRRWARASFTVMVVVLLFAATEYVTIEEDFRVARFDALRMGAVPQGYEPPRVVLLTQLAALLAATRTQPSPGMAPQDIERLKAVAMLYPEVPIIFRYSTALALNDQPQEARRQLRLIRVMHGDATYKAVQRQLLEQSEKYPVLATLAVP